MTSELDDFSLSAVKNAEAEKLAKDLANITASSHSGRKGIQLKDADLLPVAGIATSTIPPEKELESTQYPNPRHGGDLDLAEELGVDLSQSPQDLVHSAALNMNRAATLIVKAGLELRSAKDRCERGQFEAFCKSTGVSSQRASEAMRYAKYASQIPADQRHRYLMLPKKSALLLGNADPEVIEFLLEDDQLAMTKRIRTKTQLSELARELVDTEDALDRHAKENEALHSEIKSLRDQQEAAVSGSEYPASVVMLRKESSVLADEAIAALSSIRTNAERYAADRIGFSDEARKRNHIAAVHPMLANIAVVMKEAQNLFMELTQYHDVRAEDIATFSNIPFSEHELTLIESARQNMLARKKGITATRQSLYAEKGQLKRKKGRQETPA